MSIIIAQANICEINQERILAAIEEHCATLDNNEACYANIDVQLDPQDDAPPFSFELPGDLTSVEYIRSLQLSAFNPDTEAWGITQLRLLATMPQGPEEVRFLLFGDVEIEDEVQDAMTFMVMPTIDGLNVRNQPVDGFAFASLSVETETQAIARNVDSSWVRVVVPTTGAMGWVSSEFLTVVDTNFTLADLPTQTANQTQYSSMTAFTLNSGSNGGIGCSNVTTDGMLIQTPAGVARVSLLINEVLIDVVSNPEYGGTVFASANVQTGLNVDVLAGSAEVESNGVRQFVNTGLRTNITLGDDLRPIGSPSVPQSVPNQSLRLPILPALVSDDVPLGNAELAGFQAPEIIVNIEEPVVPVPPAPVEEIIEDTPPVDSPDDDDNGDQGDDDNGDQGDDDNGDQGDDDNGDQGDDDNGDQGDDDNDDQGDDDNDDQGDDDNGDQGDDDNGDQGDDDNGDQGDDDNGDQGDDDNGDQGDDDNDDQGDDDNGDQGDDDNDDQGDDDNDDNDDNDDQGDDDNGDQGDDDNGDQGDDDNDDQ